MKNPSRLKSPLLKNASGFAPFKKSNSIFRPHNRDEIAGIEDERAFEGEPPLPSEVDLELEFAAGLVECALDVERVRRRANLGSDAA